MFSNRAGVFSPSLFSTAAGFPAHFADPARSSAVATVSDAFVPAASPLNASWTPRNQNFGPSEISDALIDYTLQNGIEKPWLADFITRGLDIGKVEEISCIYKNPTLDGLLDHPENYRLMSDLLNQVDKNEDELLACLTVWQKLKYGPRLRAFSDDLWDHINFFDGFVARLARMKGMSGGKAAVETFSYFFRTDRVDSGIQWIMDDFRAKLERIVASENGETTF